MGARLVVEEVLEDDLLLLLLLKLVCGVVEMVLTAEVVENFAEATELVFLLVEETLLEDLEGILEEDGLTDDFEEDFAEVLVLNFLLVEESLTEDFEEDLAVS
jgi:hypothetical protein